MPTTSTTQKTLHQRNKSSPALSTMLQAGALKMAAKRTAFGDVSNVANVVRPSKDDSAIGGKGQYTVNEKALPTLQEKKITSFLRPAQRPLSVSGLKGLLNNVTTSTHPPLIKQPLVELHQSSQPTDAKQPPLARQVSKEKSTAVFKDISPSQPEQPQTDTQKPQTSTAAVAPIHRELLPQALPKETIQTKPALPTLTREASQLTADTDPREFPAEAPLVRTSEEPAVLRSDGIYIDEQGQVRLYDDHDTVDHVEYLRHIEKQVVATAEIPKQDSRGVLDPLIQSKSANIHQEPPRKSVLASLSEPEEYWDDEGEENFDEEGYVTARSFKSRGENTTGGATTILFPKMNQKARREIAAAKDLIEGSKTREELEDEAWDTTMVAEYGEEIFGYMKDLEVRS